MENHLTKKEIFSSERYQSLINLKLTTLNNSINENTENTLNNLFSVLEKENPEIFKSPEIKTFLYEYFIELFQVNFSLLKKV